ncbi:MAG: YfhO family protein [Armatimonadetes bacterium]|nr:YfhO family protein [Armatimonadota bacterium]
MSNRDLSPTGGRLPREPLRSALHLLSRVDPTFVLFVLSALLFLPMLLQGKVLFWADYFLHFEPYRSFTRESFWHNEIPLWNPYVSGGMPFVGNLQSAVFYPLNLLYLLLPTHQAFGVSAMAHVYLFGFGMYQLLRSWGLGKFGGLCGAVSVMLGGCTVCHVEYPTVLCAAVWLPWLLLLIDRGLAGNRRAQLVFPLVLATQLLAGHLQIAVMSFFVVVAYWIFRVRTNTGQSGNGTASATLPLCLGVVAGMLLALPQLLPTLETLVNSARAETSFKFASIYSLPPWQLTTLLLPNAFGNPTRSFFWGEANFWELAAYTGLIGWLFVASALQSSVRKETRFFFWVACVSLLIALGKFTPVYGLLYRFVPGFESFKGPGRFLYLFTFSLSVLIGLGADRVAGTMGEKRTGFHKKTTSLLVTIAGAMATLLLGRSLLLPSIARFLRWQFHRIEASAKLGEFPRLSEGVYTLWLQDLIVALLLVVAVFLANRLARAGTLPAQGWKVGLLGIIVVDLLAFGMGVNPWTEPSLYTGESSVATFLQSHRGDFCLLTRPSLLLHTWGKYVPFVRPVSTDPSTLTGLRESLAPNRAMRYHLRDLEGYDPLKPAASMRRVEALNRALDSQKDVAPLTAAGVRFVIAYNEGLTVEGLKAVHRREGIEVYENLRWQSKLVPPDQAKTYSPQCFRLGMFLALVTWMLWLAVRIGAPQTSTV